MRKKVFNSIVSILLVMVLITGQQLQTTSASSDIGTTSILSFDKLLPNEPYSLEVGFSWNPYVVYANDTMLIIGDANNVVHILDYEGNYHQSFGESGPGVGQISFLRDIIQFNNKIIVSDSGNDKLLVYDLNGNFEGEYEQSAAVLGQIVNAGKMATNGSHLFVLDTDASRDAVVIFNSDLDPVAEFDKDDTGNDIVQGVDIAADDKFIYVLDDEGTESEIKVYDQGGTWYTSLASGSGGQYEIDPTQFPKALLKHGELFYILDDEGVKVYNKYGNYVGGLLKPFDEFLQLGPPTNVDFTYRNGKLLILDAGDNFIFLDVDVNNIELAVGADNIRISWDTPSKFDGANVTYFNVYRGTSPDNLMILEQVSPDTMSLIDTSVEPNVTYYYAVSAGNVWGQTQLSPTKSAKIDFSATVTEEVTVTNNLTIINTEQVTEEITISEGGFALYPMTLGVFALATIIIIRNKLMRK